MKQNLMKLAVLALLGGSAFAGSVQQLPFRGLVAAVDPAASTLTLSGPAQRVLHVPASSKLLRGGAPAPLATVKVGEAISGSLDRANTNRLVLIRANLKP
jgi:hypothetical protein